MFVVWFVHGALLQVLFISDLRIDMFSYRNGLSAIEQIIESLQNSLIDSEGKGSLRTQPIVRLSDADPGEPMTKYLFGFQRGGR